MTEPPSKCQGRRRLNDSGAGWGLWAPSLLAALTGHAVLDERYGVAVFLGLSVVILVTYVNASWLPCDDAEKGDEG